VVAQRSEIATVVALRGDRLLLVEQPGMAALALPGGKIEAGETPRAAAARELAEETGIIAPETRLVALAQRISTPYGVTLVPFLLAEPPRRRRAAELPCHWIAFDELEHHTLLHGVSDSLAAALAERRHAADIIA
jgi:ADP-ribose pyrophosphatase YjhB (NUDIX family)